MDKLHNKKKKKLVKVDKFDTKKSKTLLLKLYLKNGEIRKYRSLNYTRRISSIISHTNFKKAYVKVSYGKKVCSYGCFCNFCNDGFYDNKEDLLYMIKVFWKED